MANQVTDNRTNISTGETATGWENIGGSALAVDVEVSYDTYSGSIGLYATTTRDGIFYNNGATGLFTSGDHAYMLVNCGIVALLDTKALGGMTVRVTGATATDWAEFELFGSDEWPTAFNGGWIQIVVDIDELLANPTNTNGSPPTVGNIQRFGVTFITATVMPRMADNCWAGGFKRLPASTPALIVEGRDGGTTDWDWATIAGTANATLSAVLLPGPGGSYVCRGPIQFGINDTSTHAFTESNKSLLWDFQEVMLDGFYSLSALGNSGGTTNVTFGSKTGTGQTSIGQQGGSIQAAAAGARWDMDFDDPNLDGVNFYGASLIHGGTFQLDDAAVEVVSTLYIDCTQAQVSNSLQVRNTVVAANTADGAAFMITDDMGDISRCAFTFSDGHAIEITSVAVSPQNNVGNTFSGYTNTIDSTDAAIYLSAGGNPSLTISASDSSDLQTNSWRTAGTGTITINNNVSVTFSGLVPNTEVRVYATSGGAELAGVEDSTTSFVASIAASTSVYYTIHHKEYEHIRVEGFTWPTSPTTIPIQQRFDDNYRTDEGPAIEIIEAVKHHSASGASVTVTHGFDLQDGDFVLAILACNGIGDGGTGTVVTDDNGVTPFIKTLECDVTPNLTGPDAGFVFFYRNVTGSEPTTYTFDKTGNTLSATVNLIHMRNVDPTDPWDVAPLESRIVDGDPVSAITATSITTTTDGCLALGIFGGDQSNIWDQTLTNGFTDLGVQVDTEYSLGVCYKQIEDAGAVGATQWGFTPDNDAGGLLVALKSI